MMEGIYEACPAQKVQQTARKYPTIRPSNTGTYMGQTSSQKFFYTRVSKPKFIGWINCWVVNC